MCKGVKLRDRMPFQGVYIVSSRTCIYFVFLIDKNSGCASLPLTSGHWGTLLTALSRLAQGLSWLRPHRLQSDYLGLHGDDSDCSRRI